MQAHKTRVTLPKDKLKTFTKSLTSFESAVLASTWGHVAHGPGLVASGERSLLVRLLMNE